MCRGFTFLELLIALALFSAGLLGILQLQFLTQKQLQEGVYMTRALLQAYNLSALFTLFNAPPGSALALQLQSQWNQDNASLLPKGEGNVLHTGAQTLITVFWQSPLSNPAVSCMQDARMCVQLHDGVLQ